jgi:hypothetical protein
MCLLLSDAFLMEQLSIQGYYVTNSTGTGTEQNALTDVSYVIVKFLQRFDVLSLGHDTSVQGAPRLNNSLTMSFEDGVWIRLSSSSSGR